MEYAKVMEEGVAFTGQGTRLSEKAPWETYSAEMDAPMSLDLAAAVAEYAEHRYEDSQTSSQNQEELCYQRELNAEIAKEYQWLKPEEYADIEQRIGTVLNHAEFITKLRKGLRRNAMFFYREHPHPDKATLIVYRDRRGLETACWAQLGYMPELSIMRFDEHGVPLNERRRGWRTCLLQMILKGIITEEKADAIFGRPKQTDAFARYNGILYAFRKAGNRLED